MLSTEAINKFKLLYQKHFGVLLNNEQAHEKGIKLVRMIGLIYRPISEEEYKKVQMRRKETNCE